MKHTLNVLLVASALIASTCALVGWSSANTQVQAQEKAQATATKTTREYLADRVHSNIIFKIRHGVSNFYGRFNDIQGAITFDQDKIENSSMSFTVKTDSVDTKNSNRDRDLKGAGFFNARQYPETSFTSTSIKATGDGAYKLIGEFTLHGTTKTIEAKMLDIRTGKFRNADVLGLEVQFIFKRSDYGMTRYLDKDNPESGPLGDTVEMIVAIEAAGQ